MHCPYCNAELIENEKHEGSLECSSKHALFSPLLSNQIREIYGNQQSISDGRIEEIGGLYCPGCGVKLGGDGCPNCKKKLSKQFVFRLVEQNPHVPAT